MTEYEYLLLIPQSNPQNPSKRNTQIWTLCETYLCTLIVKQPLKATEPNFSLTMQTLLCNYNNSSKVNVRSTQMDTLFFLNPPPPPSPYHLPPLTTSALPTPLPLSSPHSFINDMLNVFTHFCTRKPKIYSSTLNAHQICERSIYISIPDVLMNNPIRTMHDLLRARH